MLIYLTNYRKELQKIINNYTKLELEQNTWSESLAQLCFVTMQNLCTIKIIPHQQNVSKQQQQQKQTTTTVSFTDLDQSSEMIYFESILTTFEESFIFQGSWDGSKNWLELKIGPP